VKGRGTFGDQSINGKTILKRIPVKQIAKAWTGRIWPGTGTGSGIPWTRPRNRWREQIYR